MTQVLASSAGSPLSLLEQKTVPKTSRNYRRQTTSEPSFQQFPRNGIKSVRSINYYLLSCAREQIEIMQKGGNNNFVEYENDRLNICLRRNIFLRIISLLRLKKKKKKENKYYKCLFIFISTSNKLLIKIVKPVLKNYTGL